MCHVSHIPPPVSDLLSDKGRFGVKLVGGVGASLSLGDGDN